MNKFIQTIHDIYNKVLPIAQNSGIELNLDYSEPSQLEFDVEADDPELKAQLEEELKNAISRTDSGSVKLKVEKGHIIISDTGTILSRPLCESLSQGRVKVKSRVGFGTSIDISLAKAEKSDKPSDDAKPKELAKDSKATKAIEPSKSTSPKKPNKPSKPPKSTKKH